jgi:hypothetical protein
VPRQDAQLEKLGRYSGTASIHTEAVDWFPGDGARNSALSVSGEIHGGVDTGLRREG